MSAQYSPDGLWWWNEQEWVPVPAKRTRSGLKIALAVVAGLVALLVVIALVLGSAGSRGTGPHG